MPAGEGPHWGSLRVQPLQNPMHNAAGSRRLQTTRWAPGKAPRVQAPSASKQERETESHVPPPEEGSACRRGPARPPPRLERWPFLRGFQPWAVLCRLHFLCKDPPQVWLRFLFVHKFLTKRLDFWALFFNCPLPAYLFFSRYWYSMCVRPPRPFPLSLSFKSAFVGRRRGSLG